MSRLKFKRASEEVLAEKLDLYFLKVKVAMGDMSLRSKIPSIKKRIGKLSAK